MVVGQQNNSRFGRTTKFIDRVEFIESTGKQFIDLGVVPRKSIDLEVDFMFMYTSEKVYEILVGAGQDASCRDGMYFRCNGPIGNSRNTFTNTTTSNGNFVHGNSVNTFKLSNNIFYINDLTSLSIKNAVEATTMYTLFLFAANCDSGPTTPCYARVYRVKINGTTLVPVTAYYEADGRGYEDGALYDEQSGKLYMNGTCEKFIVGPIVGGSI